MNLNFTALPSVSVGVAVSFATDAYGNHLFSFGFTGSGGWSLMDPVGLPQFTIGVNRGATSLSPIYRRKRK